MKYTIILRTVIKTKHQIEAESREDAKQYDP